MKNLYHKNNKGKVYPSPSAAAVVVNSPLSSSLPSNRDDVFSVLNLLPTAIIALVSILSLQDREVLAYLITRSMKTTTTTNPFSILDEEKEKKKKKKRCKKTNSTTTTTTTTTHKPPIFDCGCFDCYTSYWFRWDSSPNRELIHQAIEAFEDHLTNGELFSNKKKNGKGGKNYNNNNNKKDKTTTIDRRGNEKYSLNTKTEEEEEEEVKKNKSSSFVSVLVVLPTAAPSVILDKKKNVTTEQNKADDFPVDAPAGSEEQVQKPLDEVVSGEQKKQTVEEEEEEEEEAVQLPASINRGGLVRKVLPDVLGLFNSRLWSLWNPTV